MAGADGVAAHGLEDFQLPLDGAVIRGSAKIALVVMVAHTLDGDALTIEEEPPVFRKLDGADAQRRVHPVKHLGPQMRLDQF